MTYGMEKNAIEYEAANMLREFLCVLRGPQSSAAAIFISIARASTDNRLSTH